MISITVTKCFSAQIDFKQGSQMYLKWLGESRTRWNNENFSLQNATVIANLRMYEEEDNFEFEYSIYVLTNKKF